MNERLVNNVKPFAKARERLFDMGQAGMVGMHRRHARHQSCRRSIEQDRSAVTATLEPGLLLSLWLRCRCRRLRARLLNRGGLRRWARLVGPAAAIPSMLAAMFALLAGLGRMVLSLRGQRRQHGSRREQHSHHQLAHLSSPVRPRHPTRPNVGDILPPLILP